MKENINESVLTLVEVSFVIIAGLAGVWWGLRMGGGILRLTGLDLRLPLCLLMLLGLLYQGCSNLKTNRKYPPLYRILLWVSGVLVSLLIYGLICMFCLDALTLLMRLLLHITSGCSSGIFLNLPAENRAGHIPAIGLVRNGTIWTFGNAAVLALILSEIITLYGLIHARIIRVKYDALNLAQRPARAAAPSASVPARSAHAVRIVHLSDLHMGSIVTAHYIQRVVTRVNALHPDYVFITGDIFNHGFVEECKNPKRMADLLRSIQAPVYAVLGNHDPQPEDPALRRFLEEASITLLHDQTVDLPVFTLAGYGGLHVNHRPPIQSWLQVKDPSKPLILLDHYPDSIHEAVAAKVDLMLSGHTHGGQYFPNNLLIWRHYARGRLMRGLSVWGNTTIIVSQGTGFFQVPIRIGTDSEILCIDLI